MSLRPAWVEIDLGQLHRNFDIINRDKPSNLNVLVVVKDQAYGHGAVEVAKAGLQHGATHLAVATTGEGIELREHEIHAPILVFGEKTLEEYDACIRYRLTCFINNAETAKLYAGKTLATHERAPIHVEIDTGLSRYGVRWTEACSTIKTIAANPALDLQGIMSHFAMSDELDKSFALTQLERFRTVLGQLDEAGIEIPIKHMCNTGGFLDLPQAYFDMVRLGILPLGVYPSQVCRRIEGLEPVLSIKARIAVIREIEPGDTVGYGMRYQANARARIAVLPIGYGDGFPRVRNAGEVLVHGYRAPIIGGNAMDATMIDVTHIPAATVGDEVVLLGRQGTEEIDVHELAALKGTVSYDVLAGFRARLPRVYVNRP